MSDCRIVFNEGSGRYRIEKRRWWGWSFVMNESGEDYLTFERCQDARHFVCERLRQNPSHERRWKVIDICGQPSPR